MRFGRLACCLAGGLALSATAMGQAAAVADKQAAAPAGAATEPAGEKPLSTRIVAYVIDAKLDPKKHTIDATETLEYLNLTGQPQQTFPFHLYMNAFQPQSTFMTEVHRSGTRGNGPGSAWDPLHKGAIDVSHLEADSVDLTDKMQFIHPDDDNAQDKTVFQVTLPKPVPPGATVKFSFTFHELLPEVVERTGYMHDFDMVGQWFPKVGVWWKNSWNCHQFHATTEFFADFGTFDVKITLPKNEVVGAGGDLVDRHDNPDGSMTLHYWSQDVHDFSWAASPSFTRVEDSWTGSSGQPVKIVVLISPGNMPSAPRYVQAIKGSLTMFDKWYGPYPYDRITLIDPPHGGSDAGGMEYPTLITGDTSWNMPKQILLPEIVTEHEFGHQYWYGMVATNEFEEAWLDEGINSYTEVKVMDALYGKNSFMNFPFAQLSEDGAERTMYLSSPDSDPISRLGWKFYSSNSYGAITYGKSATMLLTLEKVIGEDTLREALHTYFMRFRFTHPTGTDFIKTVEEVSGRDLKWYFDQAVYGTQVMDYSVANAHSDPLKWWEPAAGSNRKDEVYRTYVSVRRKGDFVFPVDVVVKFDDGSTATEHWDGQERWTRFQYDRKAKVVSAEIDPQNQVTMDRNFFNNSYTLDADARATHKMRNIFVFASEWVSQLLAWLT
jgi:hypothetical protein